MNSPHNPPHPIEDAQTAREKAYAREAALKAAIIAEDQDTTRWGTPHNYPALSRSEWSHLTGIDTPSPWLEAAKRRSLGNATRRAELSNSDTFANHDDLVYRTSTAPSFSLPPDEYLAVLRNVHIDEDDDTLVKEFLAGNHAAFNDLVAKHYRRAWFLARRYTDSYDDAYDVLQECLFRAYRKMYRFNFQSTFGTWLHRLITNHAYDHYRKRATNAPQIAIDDSHTNQEMERALSHDPTEELETSVTLKKALDQLLPEQREAIVLVDIMGYDIPKAAEKLDVKPGTIKSRRARARQELKSLIEVSPQ